jgi:hypothetical protein
MVMKNKTYVTYAQLYFLGQPKGRKHIVRITANNKTQASKFAKAYHKSWSKSNIRKGYVSKYLGIK